MKHYIEEALGDFPEEINKKVLTPAKKDLFTVDKSSPKLNEERAQILHSLTMKLMYVCQRSRPDINPPLLLCARESQRVQNRIGVSSNACGPPSMRC